MTALYGFIDQVGPAIPAALMNRLDVLSNTVFGEAGTKAAARAALFDVPLPTTLGGTGRDDGLVIGLLPGDPRLYDGVGDNVTDDSAAVLAALNTGVLYLAKGLTYYVPTLAQFTVSSDLLIYGGGKLRGVNSLALLKPAGGDIIIKDCFFDTFLNIVESDVADSGTTDKLYMLNCEVTNMSGFIIDHERPLNCAVIQGNRFDSVFGESIRIGKNDYALQDTWKKITIRDNRWISVTSSGTTSACAAIVYGMELVIAGNFVDTVNSSAGTGEAWGFYTKCREAIIAYNVIKSITSAGGAAVTVGINIKGSERGTVTAPQGFNTVVANNYVKSSGGYGIRSQADEIIITGNLVEEPGDSAFAIDSLGSNVVCTGNRGFVTTEGTTVGIRCSWNGDAVQIVNNILEGFKTCIRHSVLNGETQTNGMTLHNILKPGATGTGVNVDPAAGGTISNLVVRGNKVTTGSNGMVMPTAGTCTGMVIESNDLRGASTKISGSIPAGTRVKDNLGWVTRAYGLSAAVATGATIAHGLSAAAAVVNATPAETGPTNTYVTAPGAANFTINFGGGGSKTFYWEAIAASEYA